jgi:hypothetical protein
MEKATFPGDTPMRGRVLFIVLAVLVTAAVATFNWPEITRSQSLDFGLFTTTAPLGLILLVILGLVLAVFLVSSSIQESRYLLDHRRHSRALHEQRELAEKAEASRFTNLREHLDNHLRESRHRESLMATEFEKRLMQSHQELRAQVERLHQMVASRLDALDTRAPVRDVRITDERAADGRTVHDVSHETISDVNMPPRDRVKL